MLSQVHEHIVKELGESSRTDTIFVLTAIVFNHRLTPHFEQFPTELIVRFNLSDVEAVQESQSDRADRLATLVSAGIMSTDEARRELRV